MKARGLSITAFMAVALIVSGMVGCAGRSSAVATADSEDGGVILQSECTVCHDLGGLPAFADYWGEPEWRSLIETMIGYGADLSPEQHDVLARYLAKNY